MCSLPISPPTSLMNRRDFWKKCLRHHNLAALIRPHCTPAAPRGIYSFIAPFFGLAVFAIRASRLLYNRRISTTFLLSYISMRQPLRLSLV